MSESRTKHRRKLNAEQLEVLELLHKFRFGTNDLFAQYFGKKDRSFVYKRLSILLEQGLIGKRFEPRYRLAGLPAAYYLTPTGARLLQKQLTLDHPMNFKIVYRTRTVQDGFVQRCLDIFAAHNQLKRRYGDNIKFFTKTDLNYDQFDYFPQPLPDAYVRLRQSDQEAQYFLDFYYDSDPLFATAKRVRQFVSYSESGVWDDTGTALPTVLSVCESSGLAKRLQKQKSRILKDSAADDLVIIEIAESDIAELGLEGL